MQIGHYTHIRNCDGPRLVAVATSGFIWVPEQEVNEVQPTVPLKRTGPLSDGFKVEVFLGLSEERLFYQPVCSYCLIFFF